MERGMDNGGAGKGRRLTGRRPGLALLLVALLVWPLGLGVLALEERLLGPMDQWSRLDAALGGIVPRDMAEVSDAAAELERAAAELVAVGEELTALRVEQGATPEQVYIAARELLTAQQLRVDVRRLLAGEVRAGILALRLRHDAEGLQEGLNGLRHGDPRRGIHRVGSTEGQALLAEMATEVETVLVATRRLEAQAGTLEALHGRAGRPLMREGELAAALTALERAETRRVGLRRGVALISLVVGGAGLLVGALVMVAGSRRDGGHVPVLVGRTRLPEALAHPLGRREERWRTALRQLLPGLQRALLDWYQTSEPGSTGIALHRLAAVLAQMENTVSEAVESSTSGVSVGPPGTVEVIEALRLARRAVRVLERAGERAGIGHDVPRLLAQVERGIGQWLEAKRGAGFRLPEEARSGLEALVARGNENTVQ